MSDYDLRNYVTTATAAELIGCTQSHISTLIKQQKLTGIRMGRLWWVHRQEVIDYRNNIPHCGRPRKKLLERYAQQQEELLRRRSGVRQPTE